MGLCKLSNDLLFITLRLLSIIYYFTIISFEDISVQSVTCFRYIFAPDVIP
jgi:hypothetical protein